MRTSLHTHAAWPHSLHSCACCREFPGWAYSSISTRVSAAACRLVFDAAVEHVSVFVCIGCILRQCACIIELHTSYCSSTTDSVLEQLSACEQCGCKECVISVYIAFSSIILGCVICDCTVSCCMRASPHVQAAWPHCLHSSTC